MTDAIVRFLHCVLNCPITAPNESDFILPCPPRLNAAFPPNVFPQSFDVLLFSVVYIVETSRWDVFFSRDVSFLFCEGVFTYPSDVVSLSGMHLIDRRPSGASL